MQREILARPSSDACLFIDKQTSIPRMIDSKDNCKSFVSSSHLPTRYPLTVSRNGQRHHKTRTTINSPYGYTISSDTATTIKKDPLYCSVTTKPD